MDSGVLKMAENRFPRIKKEIMNFIDDEEGNITRSKMLTVGSMIILLGIIAGIDANAAHSSHIPRLNTPSADPH